MRSFFVCLFLLLCLHSSGRVLQDTIKPADIFLRVNPTGLADLNDLTLSVGVERRFSGTMALAVDVAYIPYSQQFEDAKSTSGFIVRPAIRFFPNNNRFYFEGELHFKQVTHRIEDWLQREASNDVGSYEQFTTFRYRKSARGFHVKAGRIYKLTRDSRLWYEIYLGVGVHYAAFNVVKEPRSAYPSWDAFGRTRNRNAVTPAIPAGFRLMYRVN